MKHFKHISLSLVCILGLSPVAFSQLVTGGAFIQTDHLEIAIDDVSGAYLTYADPPEGYHFNQFGTSGMVADVDGDGWETGEPALCGDYFAPGAPVEGFAIQVDDDVYLNDFNAIVDMPGDIRTYQENVTGALVTWKGQITEKQLEVRQLTKVKHGTSFVMTYIFLTNTGDETLNNIYYCRSTDPDQDALEGGGYATNNIVAYNPPVDEWALVTAEGLEFGCFLGLGSLSSDARVSYGGFSLEDAVPSEVWNGTDGHENSGSVTSDEAISIAFRISDLMPGETRMFAFVYGTNHDDIIDALEITTDEEMTKMAASLNMQAGTAQKLDFMVSPNPGDGHMQLYANGIPENAELHIEIVNMLGEMVQQQQIENTGKTINTFMELNSNLPGGTYFITLQAGDQKIVRTLIVNR